MTFDEALAALGRCTTQPHASRRRGETVPLDLVVGTLARVGDFDREFRPLNPALRPRWEHLAGLTAAGVPLPAVELVRLGELYFVDDGHHRISVARARGQLAIDAHVRAVCTVAFACACLTRADLAVKAAERGFLDRVPLPDAARRDLWLDDPTGYAALAAAARHWSDQHGHTTPGPGCVIDAATAAAWWQHHVIPLAHTARCVDPTSTAAAYLWAHDPSPPRTEEPS